MLKWQRVLGVGLLLLSLSGCQVRQAASVSHAQAVWGKDHWRLSGVMSVTQGKRLTFAHYRWTHTSGHDVIKLFGTFHLAGATLEITPDHARLTSSDGKRYVAHSVQALMREHLGWYVPVHALRYWLRGQSDPNTPALHAKRVSGQLWALTQWGWRLHWRRYHRVNGVMLPGLITLEQGKWRIRVAITY